MAVAPRAWEPGSSPRRRLRGRVAAGRAQAPMRLFRLSIGYLTLLFAAVAVTALLPAWGRW